MYRRMWVCLITILIYAVVRVSFRAMRIAPSVAELRTDELCILREKICLYKMYRVMIDTSENHIMRQHIHHLCSKYLKRVPRFCWSIHWESGCYVLRHNQMITTSFTLDILRNVLHSVFFYTLIICTILRPFLCESCQSNVALMGNI